MGELAEWGRCGKGRVIRSSPDELAVWRAEGDRARSLIEGALGAPLSGLLNREAEELLLAEVVVELAGSDSSAVSVEQLEVNARIEIGRLLGRYGLGEGSGYSQFFKGVY